MIFRMNRSVSVVVLIGLVASICGVGMYYESPVYGLNNGGAGNLPANLFSSPAPSIAMSVGYARQKAQEGQIITLYGRVGGAAKPIAQNRAIFLMTDTKLPPCSCGCPTPWDSCCVPRQKVMANMATIQVPDGAGRPLKASLLGVNGLKPATELMVKGTVLKRTATLLIVNAQSIYMNARPSKIYQVIGFEAGFLYPKYQIKVIEKDPIEPCIQPDQISAWKHTCVMVNVAAQREVAI